MSSRTATLKIGDVVKNGEIFLTSMWNPTGDDWPVFSFTRPALHTHLRKIGFNPKKDFIIYMGVASKGCPKYRRRLLSFIKADDCTPQDTEPWVRVEAWNKVNDGTKSKRFIHCLPILEGWNLQPPLRLAKSVIPTSVKAKYKKPFYPVKITAEDKATLKTLSIQLVLPESLYATRQASAISNRK